MATFDEFLERLWLRAGSLAASSRSGMQDAMLRDAKAFVQRTRGDLERWTGLLARGKLTGEQIALLVRSREDQAGMERLRQAGIPDAQLARLRESLLQTVIDTAMELFGPP